MGAFCFCVGFLLFCLFVLFVSLLDFFCLFLTASLQPLLLLLIVETNTGTSSPDLC